MPRGGPDWGFLAPQKSLMQLCREQNHFYVNVSTAALAGKYTRHQLWNPSDSLVDAFIVAYGANAEAAVEGRWAYSLDMLTGLENVGRNRYSGGTESELTSRWQWEDDVVYTREMDRRQISTTMKWIDNRYLWLKPGYGFDCIILTANLSLVNLWLWYEFPSVEV